MLEVGQPFDAAQAADGPGEVAAVERQELQRPQIAPSLRLRADAVFEREVRKNA
jgi:hypothetical protein